MIPARFRKASVGLAIAAFASVATAAAHLQTTALLAAQEPAKPGTAADGIFNADQAKRGQALYNQACSTCHQADLSGADQAPGLAGGDFLDRWNGQTVGDLVDRIRTSMPADNVGSLTTPTSTDIVAYILQVNMFPAGAEELKADRTYLKTLLIKNK